MLSLCLIFYNLFFFFCYCNVFFLIFLFIKAPKALFTHTRAHARAGACHFSPFSHSFINSTQLGFGEGLSFLIKVKLGMKDRTV